jgi:hypothetical protein
MLEYFCESSIAHYTLIRPPLLKCLKIGILACKYALMMPWDNMVGTYAKYIFGPSNSKWESFFSKATSALRVCKFWKKQ